MICNQRTSFHFYKKIRVTNEAIVEYCERCKKKLITRKDRNGRMNNDQYWFEHQRDFINPGMKAWVKEYGATQRDISADKMEEARIHNEGVSEREERRNFEKRLI